MYREKYILKLAPPLPVSGHLVSSWLTKLRLSYCSNYPRVCPLRAPTNLRGRGRRIPPSPDYKEQYPHPPPQWRPISSVQHTPPRRYCTTPPERDREYERSVQHNPHYDEGRLEPEDAEYVPARHPEGAEETRRDDEGWPVRQRDSKHNDVNWRRQNCRHRRYGMHTGRTNL